MIKRQLEILESMLDCAISLSEITEINYLEYHPVGFADMIANLNNPCSIGDVLDVVKQFVHAEIKYVIADESIKESKETV